MILRKAKQLKGELLIPGDKSISHRAIMLGSLSLGITEIDNFLDGADCLSTIACFRQMGIQIEEKFSNQLKQIIVHGKGLHGLAKPDTQLDVGNSGTTMRLLSGILSGQNFDTTLTGDASIQKRPMNRIIQPLQEMNANISSVAGNGCAPLSIQHSKQGLQGIQYTSFVASAQVKSCILFAGMYANGTTSVKEPYLSRNHSELMLSTFGAHIKTYDTTASIEPEPKLTGQKVFVPGDISSAAYFIAAPLIVPNSEVMIKNVGINPTRDGILKVLKDMGADITYCNKNTNEGEPVSDLIVRSSTLHGTTIGGDLIPTLIDEIPMLAVLACFASGTTVIKDAAELKVKESNRIDVCVENLSKMGADITATEDGMIIHGGKMLHGAIIDSKFDHRIAMSFAIAALAVDQETQILHSECVDISYPNFYQDLEKLQ